MAAPLYILSLILFCVSQHRWHNAISQKKAPVHLLTINRDTQRRTMVKNFIGYAIANLLKCSVFEHYEPWAEPQLNLRCCLWKCLSNSSLFVLDMHVIQQPVLPLSYNRIWSPTGLNTSHHLPATYCLYILYFETRKGGGGHEVRGTIVYKAGSKIPT